MKRHLIMLLTFAMLTSYTSAASYKVNSSTGKVYINQGNIPRQTEQKYYSNYTATKYIETGRASEITSGVAEIVMDYSGSMSPWIGLAKNTMAAIVSRIPKNISVGFRSFGQENNGSIKNVIKAQNVLARRDKNGKIIYKVKTGKYISNSSYCSATSLISPIAPANAQNLINGMNSVNVGGATPLTLALKRAVSEDFSSISQNIPKKIILITDGGENCGGDPCAFARELVGKRKDITIDVIMVSSNSKALKCLANKTGGKFYTSVSNYDFENVMVESVQNTTQNYRVLDK